MSGVNAHAVVVAVPDVAPPAAASAMSPLIWRRQSVGMPWPVPSGHSLLSTAAAHPTAGGAAAFSMRLGSHPGLAFLEDHRVQGAGIFPAAGFCEAAGAAAMALMGRSSGWNGGPAVLGAVVAAPLLLPDVEHGAVASAIIEIDVHIGRCKISSEGTVQ